MKHRHSASFADAEVVWASELFRVLLRGGDVRVQLRAETARRVMSKFAKMHQRIAGPVRIIRKRHPRLDRNTVASIAGLQRILSYRECAQIVGRSESTCRREVALWRRSFEEDVAQAF